MKLHRSTFNSNGILNVTPLDAERMCEADEAVLVDIREPYLNTHKRFGVKNVISCPCSEIKYRYGSFPRESWLLVIDSAGLKSTETVRWLLDQGFENVINVAGGLVEWERDGCQVIDDKRERLTGSCMCQLRKREKNK